jgi:hypothetical protein
MSLAIDRQYINFVSPQLERFRWIRGSSVAICKCPFCGDGKRGTRTRFYLYENVKWGSTGFNCECKNCGVSMSFHNFLKDHDSGLYREYRLDNFRDKYGREPREMFKPIDEPKTIESKLESVNLVGAVKLSELPFNHPCVQYVKQRKIPVKFMDYLMHAGNFRNMTASFKDAEYAKKMPEDSRLIIPFYSEFGELLCYQGRSLDPENKMRYITVKKHDTVTKTFGMDMVDRSKDVRVCEGPIDSMFISNCLAAADADLTRVPGQTYIYDSQYRNKDVCRHIDKAIALGVKVVLFPSDFKYKDINEAIMDGVTEDEVERFIVDNTYQGMKAKLVFNKLKGN